ncbi:hypothetical protein M0R04_15940 [Candidatus Dojkabacteria bacterium]|jgi:hypothetical protein|nr:hypothetical protein [Candidatus Dojkabacteria bacterium]
MGIFKNNDIILGEKLTFGNSPIKPYNDPGKSNKPKICNRCRRNRNGLIVFLKQVRIEIPKRGTGMVVLYCPYCDKDFMEQLKQSSTWHKAIVDEVSTGGSEGEEFYADYKQRYESGMEDFEGRIQNMITNYKRKGSGGIVIP